MLLRTEQISRAAQLEVAQGYLKAGTELRVIAHRFKTLVGYLGYHRPSRVCEVSIRTSARASYASAQLMQLRESEAVCALDYQRIRIRHVYSGLDDRRADKNVYLTAYQLRPYIGYLLTVHLSVRKGYSCLRYQFSQSAAGLFYRFDAIVQPEYLSSAMQLLAHGIGKNDLVIFEHEGLDRQSVAGSLLEYAHVTYAAHRHIKRSRYRSGGQGENIDVSRQLLQLFLLSDAEALLLVHNEQTEVMELYIL